MAGLVPAIHDFGFDFGFKSEDADVRDKRGHDGRGDHKNANGHERKGARTSGVASSSWPHVTEPLLTSLPA